MGKSKHGYRKHLPFPKGPYSVGCVDIMTEYSPSGCLVRMFYPAAQDNVSERPMQWPLWIPSKLYIDGYARFANRWPPFFRKLYQWFVGDIYIPALWNAPPIRGMICPIVIFSHGLGGCRTTYSTICLELASHGFIVAAVEHRDHSACFTYYMRDINSSQSNGNLDHASSFPTLIAHEENNRPTLIPEHVLYEKISPEEKEYSVRNRQVHQRAKECIKALNVLLAINRGEFVNNVLDSNFSTSSFENIMDVARIAVVGHSFGGVTAIPVLAQDKRFSVGVALDAWMYPVKGEKTLFENVTQPMLFINTEKFQTSKNIETMRRMESKLVERRMVTLSGTVHQNQSDIPFLLGPLGRYLFSASSSLNRYTALEINNKLMITFLWKYLDIPINDEYFQFLENHSLYIIEGTVIH